MNKMIAIALAALMLAAAVPSVDARTHGGRYIPGAGITIWCSADNHNLAPIGNPEDYSSPTGWLFSGEPECSQNDALNAVNGALGEDPAEGGVGGFAWIVFPSELGTLVVANTDDDLFGVGQSFFTLLATGTVSGDTTSGGCGPQSIVLPADLENHWQSSPTNPLYLFWAFIDVANATDDLTVCFSSTGTITATIG